MAYTYYYSDAVTALQDIIKRSVEEEKASILCNIATNKIWSRYDWRESLAKLPPFYLIPLMQDYGQPFTVVPSDLLGLREVYWVRTTATPPAREPVTVFRDLPETHIRSLPHAICVLPAINLPATKPKFRVFPRIPDNIGSTDYMIDGTYKKRPTKITQANMQTSLLPWDDIYFNTFLETLKWACWQLAGDGRAGAVQVDRGNSVYTGQMAVM